jgi:hypothetical protein
VIILEIINRLLYLQEYIYLNVGVLWEDGVIPNLMQVKVDILKEYLH